MLTILTHNILSIALIIGIFILHKSGDLFEQKVSKTFELTIFMISILIAVNILMYFMKIHSNITWLYFLCFIHHILKDCIVIMFIKMFFKGYQVRFRAWIALIVEAIILALNPITNWVFQYNEHSEIIRGQVWNLPYIVTVGYIFSFFFMATKNYKKINKNEYTIVIFISVLLTIVATLESIFDVHFIFTSAMSIAFLIYYAYLYIEIYKHDALTGLLDRRHFYIDAEKRRNDSMAVIWIDLNNLKLLNDNEGHAKGDLAICTVAEALTNCLEPTCRCYRIGGDEFVVLGFKKTMEQAENYLNRVKSELNHTEYTVSTGVAIYNPGDNFDMICTLADEEMYKNKRIMKGLIDS